MENFGATTETSQTEPLCSLSLTEWLGLEHRELPELAERYEQRQWRQEPSSPPRRPVLRRGDRKRRRLTSAVLHFNTVRALALRHQSGRKGSFHKIFRKTVRRKTPTLSQVLDVIRGGWCTPKTLSMNCNAKLTDTNKPVDFRHRNDSPMSPVVLRRRLSVPEIIMRKHALAQQLSRSDSNSDTESISVLLPLERKSPRPLTRHFRQRNDRASGSDGDLSELRQRKRNSALHIRKSTLLRRFWNKELERNSSTEALCSPHSWSRHNSPTRSNKSSLKENRLSLPENEFKIKGHAESPRPNNNEFTETTLKHNPNQLTVPNNDDSKSQSFISSAEISRIGKESIWTPSVSDTNQYDESLDSSIKNTPNSSNNNWPSTCSSSQITPEYPTSFLTTAKTHFSTEPISNTISSEPPDSAYSNSKSLTSFASSSYSEHLPSRENMSESVNNSMILTPLIHDVKSDTNRILNNQFIDTCVNDNQLPQVNQLVTNSVSIMKTTFQPNQNSYDHSTCSSSSAGYKNSVTSEMAVFRSTYDITINKVNNYETEDDMMSNVQTGSVYQSVTEESELLVPRYSALPRTVSMEVAVSSGDNTTDRDSEGGSLVDSLDDPVSPRLKLATPPDKKIDKEPIIESNIYNVFHKDDTIITNNNNKQINNRHFYITEHDEVNKENLYNNNEVSYDSSTAVYSNNFETSPNSTSSPKILKHDDKPVRGEIKPLSPENKLETNESPRGRKGSAYFIAMQNEQPAELKDHKIVVADHMPEHLKNKIQQRQIIIKKHKKYRKHKSNYLDIKKNDQEIETNSEIIDSNGTESEFVPDVSIQTNYLINKIVPPKVTKKRYKRPDFESIQCFKIDGKGNMQMLDKNSGEQMKSKRHLNYHSDRLKSFKQTNILQSRKRSSADKRVSKLGYHRSRNSFKNFSNTSVTTNSEISSDPKSEEVLNSAQNQETPNIPSDPENYNSINPMPRRIYQKTEFNDGGRHIEILEIVECVDNNINIENNFKHRVQQSKKITTAPFKSRIPVPVNQQLRHKQPVETSDSSINERQVTYYSTNNSTIDVINQKPINISRAASTNNNLSPSTDPALDRLIAGILIGSLNQSDSSEMFNHSPHIIVRSPHYQSKNENIEYQNHTSHAQTVNRNSILPRSHHIFEAIPEERSASMDSSTEEIVKRSIQSANSDTTYNTEENDEDAVVCANDRNCTKEVANTQKNGEKSIEKTTEEIDTALNTSEKSEPGEHFEKRADNNNFKYTHDFIQNEKEFCADMKKCVSDSVSKITNSKILIEDTNQINNNFISEESKNISYSYYEPHEFCGLKSSLEIQSLPNTDSYAELNGLSITEIPPLDKPQNIKALAINTEPPQLKVSSTQTPETIMAISSVLPLLKVSETQTSESLFTTPRKTPEVCNNSPDDNKQATVYVVPLIPTPELHLINQNQNKQLLSESISSENGSSVKEYKNEIEKLKSESAYPTESEIFKKKLEKLQRSFSQKEFYKGKAALDIPVEENAPKGWASFCYLRNGQSPPNENVADTEIHKVNQPNPTNLKQTTRKRDRKHSTQIQEHPLSVSAIEPRRELLQDTNGKRSLSENKCESSTKHAVQHSESSNSEEDPSTSESEETDSRGRPKLIYATVPPSYRAVRKQRRYPATRSRNNSLISGEGYLPPGGWSVTVTGTNAVGQQAPDLKMRLKFPTPASTTVISQSDSGLGEETAAHQALQHSAAVNKRNVSAVKIPNQSSTRNQSSKKKFQYLPDVHKTRSAAKPIKRRESCNVVTAKAPRQIATGRCSHCRQSAPRPTKHNKSGKWIYFEEIKLIEPAPGSLSILGFAITPEKKPKVPTMSERDLTRMANNPHLYR